jgi:hypothetical protein
MPSSASADTGSASERLCRYCRQPFVPSLYRHQQSVCSQPDCQKRRKTDYHCYKRQQDPVYAQTCQNSQKNWRRNHPEYNRQYRQTHPQAVEQNREGERARYRYRQLANLAKNNLALDLKRCAAEVWLLSPAGTVLAKNTLALSQIFIVQQLTPEGGTPGPPCKEHPAGIHTGSDA